MTSGNELREVLDVFLNYYNEERPHSSLKDLTPDEVHYSGSTPGCPGDGVHFKSVFQCVH
jgi:hypothetical protein